MWDYFYLFVTVRRLLSLVVSTTLLAVEAVNGQSFTSDTSFVAEARKNAIARYNKEVDINSSFFSGSEYAEYVPQVDEHPYLIQDWTYGSVNYGGAQYDHVSLLFDIAEDQVISAYPYGNLFRLVREKVRSFTMNDMTFVKVSDPQVSPGFYQLVYAGDTRFLVRHRKTLYKKVDGNDIRNAFDLKVDYYLVKDGTYHSIRGLRSLLAVLGDHKQELKKFIRERHIRYSENKEESAISILGFYDQITQ
jgi:hypothetical protein